MMKEEKGGGQGEGEREGERSLDQKHWRHESWRAAPRGLVGAVYKWK